MTKRKVVFLVIVVALVAAVVWFLAGEERPTLRFSDCGLTEEEISNLVLIPEVSYDEFGRREPQPLIVSLEGFGRLQDGATLNAGGRNIRLDGWVLWHPASGMSFYCLRVVLNGEEVGYRYTPWGDRFVSLGSSEFFVELRLERGRNELVISAIYADAGEIAQKTIYIYR